jgi:hypothetical protein
MLRYRKGFQFKSNTNYYNLDYTAAMFCSKFQFLGKNNQFITKNPIPIFVCFLIFFFLQRPLLISSEKRAVKFGILLFF